MKKIWFVALFLIWAFSYLMNIMGMQNIDVNTSNTSAGLLGQLIGFSMTILIHLILLWTLLYFRYKYLGKKIQFIDKLFIFLSTIFAPFSLVILVRGFQDSPVAENNPDTP